MMTLYHQLVLDMLDYQKILAKICFIALTIIVRSHSYLLCSAFALKIGYNSILVALEACNRVVFSF
jgi:hypothetical protein